MSGSGVGCLTGDYHWSCVNGKLTSGPGLCNSGSASADSSGRVTAASGC
jgi:hypothetical protein